MLLIKLRSVFKRSLARSKAGNEVIARMPHAAHRRPQPSAATSCTAKAALSTLATCTPHDPPRLFSDGSHRPEKLFQKLKSSLAVNTVPALKELNPHTVNMVKLGI